VTVGTASLYWLDDFTAFYRDSKLMELTPK
jgi:hypothetical protein